MGAATFIEIGTGVNAGEAFDAACKQAAWDHGHAGYTGTLAEKGNFTVISDTPMKPDAAMALANELIDQGDVRIDDKWGPAGCIPLDNGQYLFFGWASC